MKIQFYEEMEDGLLKFAVIAAVTDGKYVFCKHRDRDTLEIPGGRRETGEEILKAAKRELYEETGAVRFDIRPVCVYSVISEDEFDGQETFGMLFFADIYEFEEDLHYEIEKIIITEHLPEKWTYPLIQPKLMEEVGRRLWNRNL